MNKVFFLPMCVHAMHHLWYLVSFLLWLNCVFITNLSFLQNKHEFSGWRKNTEPLLVQIERPTNFIQVHYMKFVNIFRHMRGGNVKPAFFVTAVQLMVVEHDDGVKG